MKKYNSRTIWFIALILIALVWACEDLPEDLDEPVPNIPVPTSLSVIAGIDTLILSWEFDADFDYAGFAVFRSEDEPTSWRKVATVPAPPYTDTDLRSGVVYFYQVAGVSEDGIEGKRSASVPARAAAFTVLINNGEPYTNSRDVVLTVETLAPPLYVRFSENADLNGVPWRDYADMYPFILSPGDGTKVVYVQFRDDIGNTTDIFSASIILDTFAEISSLDFSPKSPPIPPGGTVHFEIHPTSAELDGFAQVLVEGMGNDPITVLDDGVNGDPTAMDGSYEVDYTFPQYFRGTDLRMSAIFYDAAGNESPGREFADNLSISDPPDPVILYPAVDSTINSITLSWSESDEAHFASYDVYRDATASVDPLTSFLAGRVTQQANTNFTDSDLDEATTYYYSVFVVNDLDEKTGSNVRAFNTADLPPTPVNLDPPSSIGPTRLTLTWTMNDDTDFARYEIWQDTTTGVTNGAPSVLVDTITDRTELYADITGLDTVTFDYYFRIYVYDLQGNHSRSNEVTTAEGP